MKTVFQRFRNNLNSNNTFLNVTIFSPEIITSELINMVEKVFGKIYEDLCNFLEVKFTSEKYKFFNYDCLFIFFSILSKLIQIIFIIKTLHESIGRVARVLAL